MKAYSVSDMSGKLVLKSDSKAVDISDFPSATYIITVEHEDGSFFSKKVIKK
ncbi:T9SS type A sorting domain-containing protein [Chryseobacterium sp. JAH]|uniref:T9SS type A sorting domain-containing protein n=1 Tax=Chryseobacterium sp. JAH TaxID=1742858 RepID=UPI00397739E2